MTCPCGHAASDHALLDHDHRGSEAQAEWRREQKLARYHWICQADVHPDGQAESPWDHVCGCIVNVWENEPGKPTVDDTTDPVIVEMVRAALLKERGVLGSDLMTLDSRRHPR